MAPNQADARPTTSSERPFRVLAMFGGVVFVVLALAYSWVTPLGEAPDEAAHLEYVREVARAGRAPVVPALPGEVSYELHQPPLAYLAAAAALRAAGWDSDLPTLCRSADFDFTQPPKPYVAGQPQRGWWAPRLLNVAWAVVFVPALWGCAAVSKQAGRNPIEVVQVFLVFLLVPQLVFSFATFSNDAATIALSTVCFALFLRAGETRSTRLYLLAAIVAGVALWAKLTAAFLFAPLVVIGVARMRRGIAAAGVALWSSLLAGLLAFQATRGIPFGHAVPPSWKLHGGPAVELITEPGWMVTLWLGTWAKLGWFNVHLPVAAYTWFLLPTAAIAGGSWAARRERGVGAIAAVSGIGAALALLMVYMVSSDWQPQGRLVLPTIGPACALAVGGASRWGLLRRNGKAAIGVAAVGGVGVCLLGLRALAIAYPG